MGLGGEHLIPPRHAWRSVTNPAPALGTRAAPNAPAAASVNTLLLLGCERFRNGINKEVAAQPGHQVTPASQTAHALPAMLCPAARSADTLRGQGWALPP